MATQGDDTAPLPNQEHNKQHEHQARRQEQPTTTSNAVKTTERQQRERQGTPPTTSRMENNARRAQQDNRQILQLHDQDRMNLKTRTVYINDDGFTHMDLYRTLTKDIRREDIIGLIKTNGTWQITLTGDTDLDDMTARGMGINGRDIDVRHVGRNVLTVSFFGVPVYVTNEMLSGKLQDFKAKQVSPWTRKTFPDLPAVESGIVHCRVELPNGVTSLPYAARIGDSNIVIKHNGQHKVCNLCLSDEHLMRSCPTRRPPGRCFTCGIAGHYARECPDNRSEDDDEEYDTSGDHETEDSNSDDGSDDADYRTFMTMEETGDGDNLEQDDTGSTGSGELFIAETQPETIDKKRRRVTTTENDETEDYDPEWKPTHRAQRRSQRRRVATMTVTKDGPVKTANQYEVLQDKS